MMTDYVLSGLVERRAILAGEADVIRKRLGQIMSDLTHLDAVIRQFDPEFNLTAIRAKRPRGPEAANRGDRSRVVLDVLREAGEPLTVAEVVRRVMVAQGQDSEDRALVRHVAKRTDAALARQERRGVVRATREPGQFVLWGVAL